MLKFVSTLITVEDISSSRQFYEGLLGQKVKYDFGRDVVFKGDFSIHLKSHFQTLLGDVSNYPVAGKANNGELYFEADDIESIYERLKQSAVEFIHGIQEQPWGQRVMRLYDLDGHIIEIGETMEAVILRFHSQGFSLEDIVEKSSMPREFVEQVIEK